METWFAGRFGAGADSDSSGERSERWMMGRAGGALYAAGATLAALWIALPHPTGGNDLGLVGVVVLGYLGAGLLWFTGERWPFWWFEAAVASGIVLITAAVHFSGRTSTPFVLFYLWSNLYAWYFFSRRNAALHLGLIGAAYAVALLLDDPTRAQYTTGMVPLLGAGAARWIITLGTLAAAGLLVIKLRERANRSIARLTTERNFVSNVVDTAAALVVVLDTDGRVLRFNRACERVTGHSVDEVAGRPWQQFIPPEDLDRVQREWPALLAADGPREFDCGVLTRSGERRLIAWSAVTGVDEQGQPDHVIATGIDVSDRKRSERELRDRLKREAAVAELGRQGLEGLSLPELTDRCVRLVADELALDHCQLWEVSPYAGDLELIAATGGPNAKVDPIRATSEAATQPGFTLQSEGPVIVDDFAEEERFAPPPLPDARPVASGLSVTVPGPRRPFGVLCGLVHERREFSQDEALFLQSVAHVVAAAIERWRSEETTRHNALHDPLTGLPNRTLFLDRLARILARREGVMNCAAVMFLDVDNFKLINDSLGHEAGDRLLRAAAPRLAETLRPSDTVARFGGDEFVVLCEDVANGRDALEVAHRLQESLAMPFVIDDEEHFLTASIGVALANGRYSTPEEVMRDADAAMYRAKERGRANCELFDDAMRDQAIGRLRLESGLRGAVERDELRAFYQPVVTVSDGSVVAMEALMRWQHPGLGPVSPLEFIPVAEDTGLIVALGKWMLEEVCRQAALWDEELGDAAPLVSVNLSPRQVAHAELVPTVARVLAESGLDPSRLGLEITESVLITEAESPWNTLQSLKRLGVTLMLDDFGTGWSSLSYLKRFPVDVLKIDRTFIDGLGKEAEDSAIVRAVVGMAQALEMTVVAEGVETERQAECLRELGCERAQGFYYGRPRPAADMTPLLRAGGRVGPALLPGDALRLAADAI